MSLPGLRICLLPPDGDQLAIDRHEGRLLAQGLVKSPQQQQQHMQVD
jgi:hypothetical protein